VKSIIITLLLILSSAAHVIAEVSTSNADYWRPYAERGDAIAQWVMGKKYESGKGGVSQDYKIALNWYQLSAEQSDFSGQTALGDMYYDGKGVAQDYKTALYWYQLAAEKGYFVAQLKLGDMYYEGKIVSDYVRAHMWWNIVASGRSGIAMEKRNTVEDDMTANQVELARKLARECVSKNYKDC